MRIPLYYFYSLILIPLIIGITSFDADAQLPEGFSEETITDEFFRPVGITFDPNGQGYVWEKNGLVYVVDSSDQLLPEPLLDLREEVGDWGDHGMLGFTLDPDFLENGYFYLMYVVDRHHLLYYGSPAYEPDSNITNAATIGRIVRYQADPSNNFTTTIQDSRKVLIGESIDQGIPILIASHGVGSLFFGTDGTLLASTGEGGSFLSDDVGNDNNTYFQTALDEGIIQPHENVGSLRAQMVDNLNGKVLRIDPETGDGVPSNPYYDETSPRAPRSRVYALGFRNPFRCMLRPGTGSHNPEDGNPGVMFIGEVGGDQWEELNICDAPAQNFGWPFFEGIVKKDAFWEGANPNPTTPNPNFGIGDCDQEFYTFQELIKQPKANQENEFEDTCNPDNAIPDAFTYDHKPPTLTYSNKLGNLPPRAQVPIFNEQGEMDTINVTDPESPVSGPEMNGYTSVTGVFYDGDNFPEEYQGKYLHADYSWWIKALDFDEQNVLHSIEDFHNHSDYVLSLAVHPKNGCLYYINFVTKLQRICFGGNNPPVAIAEFDQQYGPAPLEVQFTGDQSYDPEGTTLDYFWDFGDGNSSSEKNPTYTFTPADDLPKRYDVLLTVTDSLGASTTKELIISPNNTPPIVEISSFEDGDTYSINGYSELLLRADAYDAEQFLFSLDWEWITILKHNTHEHAEAPINDRVTQTLIEPLGCADNEVYWYQIQVAVKDSFGLVGRDTSELFPYCEDPFFELEYWRANAESDRVILNWSAITESDLDYYEVQRITTAQGIRTIGNVNPAGAGLAYHFEDQNPVLGYNNYRLKVFRNDGTFDFTEEIRVTFPPVQAIKVYPNPTEETATFELDELRGEITIELFSAAGALILSEVQTQAKFDISLAGLPVGIYTYRILNGSEELTGTISKIP